MAKYRSKRSGEAVAAQHRNAGPMKHRNAPRGGSRNEQADLLDEYDDECEGHPAGPFDPMGRTVYCDGSCRRFTLVRRIGR